MQTTAAPWNQVPQLTADVVQISILVADRRDQHVDPVRTGIKVDRLINPRAGPHSPNTKITGRKRHIGYPHRLIADVNSLVRLELSPDPTGDWEVEAGPPVGRREPASAPLRPNCYLDGPILALRSGAHELDSTPMNTFTPVDSSTSQMLTASQAKLKMSSAGSSPPSQHIRHDDARPVPPVANPILKLPPP